MELPFSQCSAQFMQGYFISLLIEYACMASVQLNLVVFFYKLPIWCFYFKLFHNSKEKENE